MASCTAKKARPTHQEKAAVAEGELPLLDLALGGLEDHQALSVSGLGHDGLVGAFTSWK